MKRKALWSVWALIPVGLVALHFGPGQKLLARDQSADHLSLARAAALAEDWETAISEYAAARDALPADDTEARDKLNLAAARIKMESGNLVEASEDFETMLGRELAAEHPRPNVVRELRSAAAESSYYTAWAMRLEGATDEEWKPETEKARQQYRLLAETSTDVKQIEEDKKNLEAVIRLEQMDLNDLKAKPLPKQCNCKGSCCQKKREQRLSKSQGKGKSPSDARKDINTNSASDAVNHGKGS